MRDFAELLSKKDSVDSAACLIAVMMDLIDSTYHSLLNVESGNVERVASDAVTSLEIMHACAMRAADGVEELQRLTGRGFWSKQENNGGVGD